MEMARGAFDIRIPKARLKLLEDDGELSDSVFEPIAARAVLLTDPIRKQYSALRKLSPGQQAVFTACNLDGEVCNGGFAQYFFNSSGMFAEHALMGLRFLGAKRHAALLESAITVFPRNVVPKSRRTRRLSLYRVDRTRVKQFAAHLNSNSVNRTSATGNASYLAHPKVEAFLDSIDKKYFSLTRGIDNYCGDYIRTHPEEFFK